MRISNYPYGRVTKTLRKAVTWLNRNKHRIIKEAQLVQQQEDGYWEWCDCFDYPDYLNMPKSISKRLNSDEVDWLQYEIFEWEPKSKR